MAGRIEAYLHSDKSVPNKGGAMVEVNCKTDFAARTAQFVTFSQDAAKFAFAAGAAEWDDVIKVFPDLEDHRKEVADMLGERVTVPRITLMQV